MVRLVAVAALVMGVTGCGASETGSSPSPSPTPSPVVSSPSPSPTPSPVGLTFKLNGIHTAATGVITVTKHTGSTTIELKITGLQPTSSHVSHIHIGSCQATGGIKFALNQVRADGDGNSDTVTIVNATFPPASGKWYVVVHAGPDMQGSNSTYLLCGNLFK